MIYYDSPVGLIKISGTADHVSSILFSDENNPSGSGCFSPDWHESASSPLLNCRSQLEEYFEGKRKSFDFPMLQTGTSFQQRVWSELLRIPFGECISYLELAKRLGNSKASRAVGKANGLNMLSIVIPCHRVVGNNAKLVGYSGGLEIKRKLLLHEENHKEAKGKLLLLF
jgi:methylated-DNA-[protein]-cysteine S-methyltransferase